MLNYVGDKMEKKWYGISQEQGDDNSEIRKYAKELNIKYSSGHAMDYHFSYVYCTLDELNKLLSKLGKRYGYYETNELHLKIIEREKIFMSAFEEETTKTEMKEPIAEKRINKKKVERNNMFESKKTLIVVYKDELLMNQLKKLIETNDDNEDSIVGTRDGSINIVSWTEKVWLDNKKAGNIKGKILFLGDVKGTNELIPVIDEKFNNYGVKYGWAGNQAVLYADTKCLSNRVEYDEFLEKMSELPVPDFFKPVKEEAVLSGLEDDVEESEIDEGDKDDDELNIADKPSLFDDAKKLISEGVQVVEKVGSQVVEKSEELFRDKKLMKRQMLVYGIINLYNDNLEEFMNL